MSNIKTMVSVVLWGLTEFQDLRNKPSRNEVMHEICNIRKEIDKLELSVKTDVLSEACKQA